MSSRPCLAIEYVAQADALLGRVTCALDEMMDELKTEPKVSLYAYRKIFVDSITCLGRKKKYRPNCSKVCTSY